MHIRIGVIFLIVFSLSLNHFNQQCEKFDTSKISLEIEIIFKDSDELFLPFISSATIMPNGDILINSSRLKYVLVFDSEGNFKEKFGKEGRGPGEFLRNTAIKADNNGFVFVIDGGNKKISVWNSDYQLVTEFNFMSGWNAHFQKNNNAVYVWNSPFGVQSNGMRALLIYKIHPDPWRKELFRIFEYEDWMVGHKYLNTWSKWAITDDDLIVATGGGENYHIYLIDQGSRVNKTFGEERQQVVRTEYEQQQRIENARMVSEDMAEILRGAQKEKPIFTNLSLDKNELIWVHRNKEFGAREEIDVYNLCGVFLEMITLPPTEAEYFMLGIYGDRVLFRVTDKYGLEALHVYRIIYNNK